MNQKRNFPNFLEAYRDYARDNFCPEKFHLWTGISIISAALERKVSLSQGPIYHIPNLYIMLISHPGVGKSTASDRGVELLEEIKKNVNPALRVLPTQMTEPALLDLMKIIDWVQVPGAKGTTFDLAQSAGFFYASEASSSALQNTCGDFVAAMTALYDCPKHFRKKLKGEKHIIEIENACMNMLACSTFDYLRNLVNETSVMGGFASRVLYVINKERIVREPSWDETFVANVETKRKLIDDLTHINKLAGPMKASPEFKKKFLHWQPKFDRFLISLNSPRMESLYARKGTNLIKLSMILSVSESDSLILEGKHFDEAERLLEDVMSDTSFVLTSAITANPDRQDGISLMLLNTVKKTGGLTKMTDLKSAFIKFGGDAIRLEPTLKLLVEGGDVQLLSEGSELYVKLLKNPDIHL